jgi:oxygen-dependent protoporphyrinogen oxidase
VIAPRADTRRPLGDRAIGPLVARKLGPRVVERLADPLIGGIHAGSVSDMSTAAVYPTLLAVAQRRGSFMKALRHTTEAEARARTAHAAERGDGAPDANGNANGNANDSANNNGNGNGNGNGSAKGTFEDPPMFWALEHGVSSLPEHVVAALCERGATVRTGCPVGGLKHTPSGWVVDTPDEPLAVDGIVLATPAPVTADLIERHDADAAKLLRDIDYASVTLVTLVYPEDAVPEDLYGTGLLVPRGSVLDRASGDTALVTACTYLSQKWPHLSRPGDVLLRASVGRLGDDRHLSLDDNELVARVTAELATIVGVQGAPSRSLVTRWPDTLPQYRVNHLLRVAGVESAVGRLGAVAVAGAAYRGIGIPACIASGRTAARNVATALFTP